MRVVSIVGCVVISFGLMTCGASAAAEFSGPTSSVELPAFRPEEMAKSVVVAKGVGTDAAALTVGLLNPDAPLKGGIEKMEVVADPATKTWRVEAVMKSKTHKPVGKLAVEGDSLTFKWEPTASRADGGPLRNCVVTVSGPADQFVALRMPLVQKAIPLDLTKDVVRLPLTDDLPDEAYLTLAVSPLQGGVVPGEASAPEAKLKESILINLKKADESSPGAHLRIALWKTPTQKPEIVLRPELTPAVAAAPLAPDGTPAGSVPTSTPTSTGADLVDPTKQSPNILLFTNRSLAAAKSALGRQLQQAKSQVVADQNLAIAKQTQLAKFDPNEDDPNELAIMAQLQSDASALGKRAASFIETVIPNLEKQLAAIDPMEKLRASLHLKSTIALRVYYTVAGKPVNVFTASDDGAK